MIIRTQAIPLAYYPYSSTSRVVHWLTRDHGKVSTLLKGALRPKSPFLGEYELFSTSELLYYPKRAGSLHVAKECALLESRDAFRRSWRAMQAASYITSLFNRTSPDESPEPGQFTFFEELIEYTSLYGIYPAFLIWAELKFCDRHGHSPNLDRCTICSAEHPSRFSAAAGGMICTRCTRRHKHPSLDCPPDVKSVLRSWQRADNPGTAAKTRLSGKQMHQLNLILNTFITRHFNHPPELRHAATEIPSQYFQQPVR